MSTSMHGSSMYASHRAGATSISPTSNQYNLDHTQHQPPTQAYSHLNHSHGSMNAPLPLGVSSPSSSTGPLSSPSPSPNALSHTATNSTPHSPSVVNGTIDDGTILFIGDLSRTVKEEDLHLLFSPFGTVVAIDIKRDRLTLNNLGFAFVQFQSRAEAQVAKKTLNGFELNSRKIRIGWAQKNTTLFIGDLDGSITTEDLIRVFEMFGPIIAEETFVKEPSRKYGFVRFHCREDAERAKSEMNHKLLGSRPIRIGWGDSNFEKHCVHIQFDPNACHLHNGTNVNAIFTEQFFIQTFTPYATAHDTTIVNISLPKHNHTKKLKGFAFIHYEENDNGEKAAILALQTLTSQFESPTSPQSFAQSSPVNPMFNPQHPLTYVHHLQQSFSPRQGAGHIGPQTNVPNNNSQQHILGGIPVKYSFGKRQIFSRHRRANENATNGGLHHSHGHPHAHSHSVVVTSPTLTSSVSPMSLALPAAAMMMQHQQQHQQQGIGNEMNGHMGAHGHGGRGGMGARNNYARTNGANVTYSPQAHANGLYNNNFPFGAQSGASMSLNGSRYHTNPQHHHHPSHSPSSPYSHPSTSPSSHSSHASGGVDANPTAQAAAATSWMIQNLAAQHFPVGMAPLSVQQVQQAYQQIQQQQQQAAVQGHANSSSPSHMSGVFDSPSTESNPSVGPSQSPPDLNHAAATNLATAANAFFSAQSQLYMQQQHHHHQQHHSNQAPPTSSARVNGSSQQPSPSSMNQMLSDMSSFGLASPNSVSPSPSPSSSASSQSQSQSHHRSHHSNSHALNHHSHSRSASTNGFAGSAMPNGASSFAINGANTTAPFYQHQPQQQQQQQQVLTNR